MEINAEQIFQNVNDKQYEYLTAAYWFKGVGRTGEFEYLYINGKGVIEFGGDGETKIWGDRESELFEKLGNAGWQLIACSINRSEGQLDCHYARFMRELP